MKKIIIDSAVRTVITSNFLSEAVRNSNIILASGSKETFETGEAEAMSIYAQAYSKDRSFFDFWRAIESYKTTLPNLNKTVSTSMDYFNYIYGPRGR